MDYFEMNRLAYKVIGAAIEVHKNMGPGLFEAVYEECLMSELEIRGIQAQRQIEIPLLYKGRELKNKYLLDILIEGEIIIELKTVKELNDVHTAQIISYLKLADKRLGFLMNFHAPILKSGMRRFTNGFPANMFPSDYDG